MMKANSFLSPKRKTAALLLEDGAVFYGYSFGAEPENYHDGILGEVIFNTAMSGYQEVLTDPSYTGQIVAMTYPMIGNYGINDGDWESKSVAVSGFVVHEYVKDHSNFRAKKSLGDYLKEHNIPGLCGIDTRSLTRHIRSKGVMNAMIFSPAPPEPSLKDMTAKLKKMPPFGLANLVGQVSTSDNYEWDEKFTEFHGQWRKDALIEDPSNPLVAVLDLGVKHNILRNFRARGCRLKVFSVTAKSEEILAARPKGVFLSNGPGDPDQVEHAVDTVKQLLGKVPIFGICMGHQILAEAVGARTFKMKFGHHGANQPVLDKKSGRVMITSQNHGYAVDPESLPEGAEITQVHLNDNTVAGMAIPKYQAFSTQYHPEANPGPRDAEIHFEEFLSLVKSFFN